MEGPKHAEAMETIQEFADFLNSLEGLQREIAIAELRERTVFCWNCYMTMANPSRCQCDNDD